MVEYAIKPNPTKPYHVYLIYIYKEDLALNNLRWLMCHKTQPNKETQTFPRLFDSNGAFERL